MTTRDEAPALEFWFDFASTYAYPAAMVVEERAAVRGVRVVWRPFLLGPIFAGVGWRDSPFNLQPAKGRYMWRDVARLCEREGLMFRRPDPFPQHSVLAARLALVLADHGQGPDFCRAVFHTEFAEGGNIRDWQTLSPLVEERGLVPETVRAEAGSDRTRQRLRDAVTEAEHRGVFGAPTFFAGDEMFWGFDRLDMALDCAAGI